MKTTILGMASVAFLWSSGAAADPFVSCSDAGNYGYNTTTYFVSSLYNRASCDRDAASKNEQLLIDILPPFLANAAKLTSPEKRPCLLQGSIQGWLATIDNEYEDCAGVPGFEAIPQRLVGQVVGALLRAFYEIESTLSAGNVPYYLGYPYDTMPLTGTYADCKDAITLASSGVPADLVDALVETACQ